VIAKGLSGFRPQAVTMFSTMSSVVMPPETVAVPEEQPASLLRP
jgi:hypothetical protein